MALERDRLDNYIQSQRDEEGKRQRVKKRGRGDEGNRRTEEGLGEDGNKRKKARKAR